MLLAGDIVEKWPEDLQKYSEDHGWYKNHRNLFTEKGDIEDYINTLCN